MDRNSARRGRQQPMAITQKSTKILWAEAAGRCSFADCWQRLCSRDAGDAAHYTIGEMAHIRGDRPGSNRHDPSQPETERDDYSNLILLCPTHHRLIDRKENEALYTAEILHEMKAAHEAKASERLDIDDNPTRIGVARKILVLLTENRASWAQYGPCSEIARREPNNEEVHAVWLSERLSIIAPNNRKISDTVAVNRNLFMPAEQAAISSFLIHARSYDRWIQDEIHYSAVARFPADFETMIKEAADAGIQ